MQPIVIDTDMGVDDALAILLALRSPEVELVGISTVAGNVPMDRGTRNALQVVELLGRDDIPVYMGAAAPLERDPVDAQGVHGPHGLGEAELPDPQMLPAGPAIDFLISEIQTRPGELVVVATGPLTNLVLAERKSPGVLNCARRVLAMGGTLWERGNITPTSEFNSYADPHALRELIRADVNLTLVPLDVTQKLDLLEGDIKMALSGRDDALSKFIHDSTRTVIEYGKRQGDFAGLHLHDPSAIAMVIDPTLFETRALWFDVATSADDKAGQLIIGEEGADGVSLVECAVDIEVDRFMQMFKHRVFN